MPPRRGSADSTHSHPGHLRDCPEHAREEASELRAADDDRQWPSEKRRRVARFVDADRAAARQLERSDDAPALFVGRTVVLELDTLLAQLRDRGLDVVA